MPPSDGPTTPPPTDDDLRAAGRRDGRNNHPPQAQQGETAIEQAAIDASVEALRRLNYTAAERARSLEEEYRRTARSHSVPDLSTLTDETLADVARLKTEAKSQLASRRRDEREMLRDLNLFKRENNLNRAATFPHSVRLHIAIVVAVLLVESGLNMYFFALGSAFGLIGGFLQALILSFANVGLGFLAGYFLVRNTAHRSNSRRIAGAFSLIAFVSIAISVNIVAAHYRDLLEFSPDSAIRSAVPAAIAAPLDLSLNAILLALVGCVSAAIGMYEGLRIDDPYPGYGAVYRRYRSALHDYEVQEATFRERIVEIVESVQGKCAALLTETEQRLEKLEGLETQLTSEYDRYAANRAGIEEDCHRRLKVYREENRAIRTAESPAYFGNFPAFPPYIEPSKLDELRNLLEQLKLIAAQQRKDRAKLKRELASRIESESDAFDKLIDELANSVSGHELLYTEFGADSE